MKLSSILIIILNLTNYAIICKYECDLKHNNLRNLNFTIVVNNLILS